VSETVQTVTREVPISADRLFAVLTDPAQHPKIDGSGMVRGSATTERIAKVDDVFRIDMSQPGLGEYQVDNRVVEFEDGHKIAWAPSLPDGAAFGHLWIWKLSPDGDSTTVTHICDWSAVTDEEFLALVSFPRVSSDQMAKSIDNLAAAAS
jgi:uncharacterized protein YndB with AHSA1/START domain